MSMRSSAGVWRPRISVWRMKTNDKNHRLEALEETVKQVAAISTSVEKLALNMENMLKEQVNQGKRLETLESQDGEKWRKAVWCVISAIIGIAVGMIFRLPVS